jgi:uncharacterized membrane protein
MRIRNASISGAVLGLTGLAVMAQASPDYIDVLLKKYELAEASAVAKKSCAACHVSDEDFQLNPYGKHLDNAARNEGKGPFGEATLAAVESLDSDGDGTPNGEELKADTLPGDSQSGAKPGVEAAPPPAPAKSFVPKNGWHPAIVHFPIGLFIAGLLLDFIGMVRGIKTMLFAGWYNIVFAAATSLAAVASGFLAMTLLKFPYKGLILQHIYYAGAATVAMWIMVALRVHRHEKMQPGTRVLYYLLAVIGLLSLSWAGHLGGVVVYGE